MPFLSGVWRLFGDGSAGGTPAYQDPVKGTLVVSPLTPGDLSIVPTHIDALGLGGLVACATVAERDAIGTLRRKPGMLASVVSPPGLYRLANDLVTWVALPVGSHTEPSFQVREFSVSLSTGTVDLYFLSPGESLTRATVFIREAWDGSGASLSVGFDGVAGVVVPSPWVEVSSPGYSTDTEVIGIDGPGFVSVAADAGSGATTGEATIRLYIAK